MKILKNLAEYISFMRTTHQSGEVVTWHCHDSSLGGYDFELVYVLSGSAKNIIKGCTPHDVCKGSYFFLDGGIEHSYVVDKGEDFKIINLVFDNRALDLWYKKIDSLGELAAFYGINPTTDDKKAKFDYYFTDDDSGTVKRLFLEIGAELSERLPGYYEVVRCRLMEILIKGFRQYFKKESIIKCSEPIRYIIDYLSTFYMENTTLSSFAEKLQLSLPYLSKKFKEEIGQTYLNYVNTRRITESCRILSTSDISIEAIAEFIGYSDSKKYREKFKELMGISPREYRKRMRNQY